MAVAGKAVVVVGGGGMEGGEESEVWGVGGAAFAGLMGEWVWTGIGGIFCGGVVLVVGVIRSQD